MHIEAEMIRVAEWRHVLNHLEINPEVNFIVIIEPEHDFVEIASTVMVPEDMDDEKIREIAPAWKLDELVDLGVIKFVIPASVPNNGIYSYRVNEDYFEMDQIIRYIFCPPCFVVQRI